MRNHRVIYYINQAAGHYSIHTPAVALIYVIGGLQSRIGSWSLQHTHPGSSFDLYTS